MKVKTAVARVWAPIELVSSTPKIRAEYELAATLLKKYQRKFGNRHFNQYLRTCIKNGLWETEGKE
jgi:hypothetical protein